jgi:hypothetical protein
VKRLALLVAVLLGLAFPAGSAFADVHGVSQAGCAAEGAPSGAQMSREAPGRPAGPIPVNATDNADPQGQGGDAPAQGTNCG